MDERTCSWLCIVGLIKHGNSFRILRSQSEQNKNIHILYKANQLNYFGNTVVPATAGHRWFGAKVAGRGRWPAVAGGPSWQGIYIYAPLCQIKQIHQTAYIL